MNEEIVKRLIEHDEKLDNLVTKHDFVDFRDQMLSGQDHILKILTKLDEERIFTIEWVKRIDTEIQRLKSLVAQQQQEIQRLKAQT